VDAAVTPRPEGARGQQISERARMMRSFVASERVSHLPGAGGRLAKHVSQGDIRRDERRPKSTEMVRLGDRRFGEAPCGVLGDRPQVPTQVASAFIGTVSPGLSVAWEPVETSCGVDVAPGADDA
jgi:hypothetical protein